MANYSDVGKKDGDSPDCRCILKLDVISGGLLITVAGQGTVHVVRYVLDFRLLKGTVQRDFSTPVFFTKRLVLVSIDMPKSDFEFCQIFVELFVLKISKYRLPAVTDSGE